jgi:hypothetical protein
LVARSLERDWNEKLTALARLEREYATQPPLAAQRLGPTERHRIRALAQDLPRLWYAPTITPIERKQLVRLLIKDVTLTKGQTTIRVAVRWQTQACSTLEVARPRRIWEIRRTAPAVVTRVREWAPTQTDQQIADRLNAAGFTSGHGGRFSASKVEGIRYAYHIQSGCPQGPAACPQGQRGDGRYSAQAAAALLNVTVYTVADWCKAGTLDGVQAAPHGPWWVKLTPEAIATLRKPVPRHWTHRRSAGTNRERKHHQP